MLDIDNLLSVAADISAGKIPKYLHDECFTSGAFDLLLKDVRDGDAFDVLSRLCRRFDAIDNRGDPVDGYYYLLSVLARQTNTTEMPDGMSAIIEKHPDLSLDLEAWYRAKN